MYYSGLVCRVYPNKEQEELLNSYCGATRFLYNYLLGMVKKGRIKSNRNAFSRMLTHIKRRGNVQINGEKKDVRFLRYVPSNSLQIVCKDLEQAFINFYKKYNKDCGYPKFKSREKCRKSIKLNNPKNYSFSFHSNKLHIQKTPDLKLRGNLDTLLKDTSKVREVTIYKDVDKWYASFTIKNKKRKFLPKTGKEIGLDVGVNRLYTRSDGKYTKNLRSLVVHQQSTIIELQRTLNNKYLAFRNQHPRAKFIRSNNYLKTRYKLQLEYRKMRRIKLDYLHKKSKMLVSKFDVIKVEDLQIKKMMVKGGSHKRKLNKGFADNSVSTFLNMLEYKADFYGKKLIKVDPQYTSITCSECGVIDKHSRLDQKHFKCTGCGFTINADHNAAINILRSRIVN